MTPQEPLVVVEAYDPQWPERFREEAQGLREALGAQALRIDHIGSTSVPGLAAKPIIDINLAIAVFDPMDAYQPALEALGLQWRPDDDPAHRLFIRRIGGQRRGTNVHICLIDGEWLRADLRFRDYLRAMPEVAAAYAALKQQCARQFPQSINEYWQAKSPFIQAVKRNAAIWAARTGWALPPSDA